MRHYVIEPRTIKIKKVEYTVTGYTVYPSGLKLAEALHGNVEVNDPEIQKQLLERLIKKRNKHDRIKKKLEEIKAKSIAQ